MLLSLKLAEDILSIKLSRILFAFLSPPFIVSSYDLRARYSAQLPCRVLFSKTVLLFSVLLSSLLYTIALLSSILVSSSQLSLVL